MNSRSRPAGASVGSPAVGMVTSSEGSLINVPSSMISSKVFDQLEPKLMLWCCSAPFTEGTPTCMTTADGEGRNFIGRFGVRPRS